ncbi:MAG: phytoene desaturase family protein [Chitinophagaceae bacterium]|nr:phytoene desaturase family protein [Chitinophagaceae bacterium]
MSAASFLAKAGWQVSLFEKHEQPGGRARLLKAGGFSFDMGPSWYWMPDVFERYFNQFGKKVSDYYTLHRLDPSYRVYWSDDHWDIPANYDSYKSILEKIEPGAGAALDKVMKEAAYKYEVGINKLVFKPGQSLFEFLDVQLAAGVFRLDVFTSIKDHFGKHFTNPKIRELMEFPVLFLGALAEDTPALYSLMNYADIKGGTWFPEGGMHSIVKGMHRLAEQQGVEFHFENDVQKIIIENGRASGIETNTGVYKADVVISGADYHFTETKLLPSKYRTYTESYWDKRVMAPGCLLYYVGVGKKIPGLLHHSLFFDTPFAPHARDIYTSPRWPDNPLFYASATSVTDPSQAPEGCENLFFLVPVATGLGGDSEEVRMHYFNIIADRFEKRLGVTIRDSILYFKSYAHSNFIEDYNAFKGNAYGLANTLRQTAVLKPSCRSKKVENLYFTGQLTVPGPGVPPSLISGEVVAKLIQKNVH